MPAGPPRSTVPFVLRVPRNGSFAANVFLVVAGGVLGSVLTWLVNSARPTSDAPESLARIPEVRQPATAPSRPDRGAEGSHVKLAQIMAADDPAHKGDDLRRLGAETAEANRDHALRLSNEIPGDGDRVAFVTGVFESWAAADPKAAAAYALREFKPGLLQSEAIRVALGKWGAADPRAAYVWMEENLSGPLKEEGLVSLAQSWSRKNPAQAAAWFLETGSTSQPLIGAVVAGWSETAPAEAAAWADQLKDPGNRRTALAGVVSSWAAQNPREAAGFAAPLIAQTPATDPSTGKSTAPLSDPAAIDLATTLANIWGTSDPASAASFIGQLPPGPGQIEAASTLATVWAATDIAGATAWSATLPDPTIRTAVIDHLGTSWGAIEPEKALAWLATQPAALARGGTEGALNSWAVTDAPGMAAWIADQPAGQRTDLARRSLGDVIVATDPGAALDLAAHMANPNLQADSAARFFREWRKTDDPAAQSWIQTNWAALQAPTRARLAVEQQQRVIAR